MREEPKEGRGGRGTAPGDGAPVGVASVKYSVKGTPYYVVRVVLLKMFLLVLLLRSSYTSWFSSILLCVPRGSVGACSPHSGEREREHTSLMSVKSVSSLTLHKIHTTLRFISIRLYL